MPRCSSRYSSPDHTGASAYSASAAAKNAAGGSISHPGRALEVGGAPGARQHLPGRTAAAVALAERHQRAGAAPCRRSCARACASSRRRQVEL